MSALTVSELTRQIQTRLEGQFADVDVTGELSKVYIHRGSGHAYLTLKDADARIDCVIYASTLRFLRYQPDVGAQVRALGRISVYPPRGSYQLVIEHLEPAGQGVLQAQFEALKRQLLTEGLFDASRKRPLPFLPRAVGVITSGSGAARRDIEAVLHRRSPQIPIVLYPARVEGVRAAPSLVTGLEVLGARTDLDVIIIGRGGGSIESLWGFNTEIVARAIAACPIPVISAVGHETDTTIADLVADLRAPTPSAAAEHAVPERAALRQALESLARRCRFGAERVVERAWGQHGQQVARLNAAADGHLKRHIKTLNLAQRRLSRAAPSARLTQARARLNRLVTRLHPPGVPARRAQLDALSSRSTHAVADRLAQARHRLATQLAQLDALSPLAVLARGYGIVQQPDGRVLRDASTTQPGESIAIRLHRGRLTAMVTAVEPEQHAETTRE
jgi:exodeoxyribonuclease VII large subunit